MQRVSTLLSSMDYRHSLPDIKINDFILNEGGADGIGVPTTPENRASNEEYYSSDFQISGDEKQPAKAKHDLNSGASGLNNRGNKFISKSFENESSGDERSSTAKRTHALVKRGKSKSLDGDSSDDKTSTSHDALRPVGLLKRDKEMSRSFDVGLNARMRSVSFAEPTRNRNTNSPSGPSSENTTVTSLDVKKPLSRATRSLSESHLHEAVTRGVSAGPKSPPTPSKHYGGSWNISTKPVLPPIKIQQNGHLSYNRDFCYRVVNPRAVIEDAIIKRKGFCSSSHNNFTTKNKSKQFRRKPSLAKKNSNDKYKHGKDLIPVAVEASNEFKTVIRTSSDSMKLKSKTKTK